MTTSKQFHYPPAPQGDVVDDYHGTAVPDPYRWLEDPDSAETQAWVAAQNELSQGFLAELTIRQQLKERLTTLGITLNSVHLSSATAVTSIITTTAYKTKPFLSSKTTLTANPSHS